jgi:calcineurin-like phosphoesterase family protein
MTIWFTSDTHFYHGNIIKYCNRPFSSIDEMNNAILNNFNSLIKQDDILFHLGDIAFANKYKTSEILSRVNGKKHLIIGNHDSEEAIDYLLEQKTIESARQTYLFKDKNILIWLSHFPHRAWDGSHRGALHLFGHCHGALAPLGRSFDCGVDAWTYRPISLEQVIEHSKTLSDVINN